MTNLSRDAARARIEPRVAAAGRAAGAATEIFEELESDLAWVFTYGVPLPPNADPLDLLVGFGPLLVCKRDGAIYEAGSALSPESAIEDFEAHCVITDDAVRYTGNWWSPVA